MVCGGVGVRECGVCVREGFEVWGNGVLGGGGELRVCGTGSEVGSLKKSFMFRKIAKMMPKF